MPQAMRTFQLTACPSCGSTTVRAVKDDWSGSYHGKRYVVKDLRYFQCPHCGERVYDPSAMRRIEAVSPAFLRRQRARKSA
jgi:YgiT-type zinc finger domain-containing protein